MFHKKKTITALSAVFAFCFIEILNVFISLVELGVSNSFQVLKQLVESPKE